MTRLAAVALAAAAAAACTTAPLQAAAQNPPTSQVYGTPPMSAIQPETTINLNGRGTVDRAPDMATISVGVSIDAETASTAMSQQAERMNAVTRALRAAGIAERDIQTSNLSLNPVYDYNTNNNERPRLTGYNASNQVTIRVRDLPKLGSVLDATVKAGGNTIHGISFGIDKPEAATNEARTKAIQDAMAKAELYAKAAGYRVVRIVTISENSYVAPPPMPMMARMQAMDTAAATPVSGGEVSLTVDVNVVFELVK